MVWGRELILLGFSAGGQLFLVCGVVSLYGGALGITAPIGFNSSLHCLLGSDILLMVSFPIFIDFYI